MSKYPRTPKACLEGFMRYLESESFTPGTHRYYRYTIKVVIEDLEEGGYDALPYRVTEDAVKWLILEKWTHLTAKTRKGYRMALKRFTEHYGNPVVSRAKIRILGDARPNVRWLTTAQAGAIWNLDLTPFQRLVILLELYMGLRRIETLRLTISSISGNNLIVSGKGGVGGKARMVPFHKQTAWVLAAYMEWRNEQIGKAMKKHPASTVVPVDLLIYEKGGKLHTYTEKGLDRAVCQKLSSIVGFKFSNHDLRRTFARRLHEKGSELRTIADILGHETISVTEKYIGISHDAMIDAMENLDYE